MVDNLDTFYDQKMVTYSSMSGLPIIVLGLGRGGCEGVLCGSKGEGLEGRSFAKGSALLFGKVCLPQWMLG